MKTKKRNTDTKPANEQRSRDADEFAHEIYETLREFELRAGQELSVGLLARALNRAGVTTRRGGQWTTTSVQRILKRVKQDDQNR